MGKNKKDDKKTDSKTDPLKAFRGLYDQMLKNSAEQWEELARNPLFLEKMSGNLEQAVFLQNHIKEAFNTALNNLNLPTKDDISELTTRLDNLTVEIAKLNESFAVFLANAKQSEEVSNRRGKQKS